MQALSGMLDGIGRDLRESLRRLRQSPLFTLTAALSLAVGIGANVAVFTVANALLFRPAPGVSEPERLVDIGRSQNGEGFDNNSYPNFLDVERRARTLASVYAQSFEPTPMSLAGEGLAERVYGGLVSDNYFDALGTRAVLGQVFQGDEDAGAPGESAVVVLSHRLWQRRFGSDPAVVGRALVLNGHRFTVLGIAPPGFHGTTFAAPDLWLPLSTVAQAMPRGDASLLRSREAVWLVLGGRLRPDASLAQARAELESLGRQLEHEYPRENEGRGLRVEKTSLLPGHVAPLAGFLALLTALVGAVLAIACANLAGVLLSRAATRRREIAVRVAIGAGRTQLVRLLLAETAVLFASGAVLGLGLARGLTTLLASLLPALPVPVDLALPLDLRVVGFGLALTGAAAILSGLVPVGEALRTDVVAGLKAEAQPRAARQRLRGALVVGQVALSLALAACAFLFARGLQRAATIDPGFDPADIQLARLDLSLAGYRGERGAAFARELVERARALPGVRAASVAAMVPLGGGGLGLGPLALPGAEDPRRPPAVDWNVVEPRYFETMRTPLVRGREFTEADTARSLPVIVLNETAARRFFPGQDPLGRVLVNRLSPTESRELTVVGVAKDGKYRWLGEAPLAFVAVPLAQRDFSRLTLVVRTDSGVSVERELRQLVASLDRNLPLLGLQSLASHAELGLLPQRLAAAVSLALGFVGLLLAAVGIYGVTAYGVAQRTREIGVRVALGATAAEVASMVLRQGLGLAALGLAIGLAIAAALGRVLESLLYGVSGWDAIAFGAAVLLLAAVALAACVAPARRAARLDPLEALRCD
jgi:predicted permease